MTLHQVGLERRLAESMEAARWALCRRLAGEVECLARWGEH